MLFIVSISLWYCGYKSTTKFIQEKTGDNPIYIHKNSLFFFNVNSVYNDQISFNIGKKIYKTITSSFVDSMTDVPGPTINHQFKITHDSTKTKDFFTGNPIVGKYTKEFCRKENIDYDIIKELSEESIALSISFYFMPEFSDNDLLIIWDDYVFGLDAHNRVVLACTRDGSPIELIGEDEFSTSSEFVSKDTILNIPKYFFNDSFNRIYAFYKNENCLMLRVLQ